MNKTYELSNALEVKKSFLNNLSHEIRTPLHNITTIANGLYDQWDGIDDSEKRTYLKAIVDNQDRLMSLVSNLLDVSKIRSGKLTFDYLNNDITIILKEVIAEFKYLTEPITLQIDNFINVSALLDAERIKQVIRNLLSNAIKYGGKDKPITIRVFNMDSKYIGVSVADNGVGVPVDEKDRIFELFEESSRTKSKAGGIGLGLAICKDIILAHRGKIWVEENQPAGSIFTFTIPFARLTNKRHIVVIDDDLSTQLSISLMLKSYNYDVTILGSANEALNYFKLNNNLVDIILLDLMLPDMYGGELLQRLKKIKKIKNIPIIIQTGIVDPEELENVIKLGACAYINKPFSEEILQFNIKKCLQIID
jgi:two-component system sensor histidine kinase ChiS